VAVGVRAAPANRTCRANVAPRAPSTEQRISEAARLGFRRIIVSGYLAKGGKRPKGIEVVPINSVDQLPKALFTE